MIPATTREHYITGLPALSVPFDGILADWRIGSALSGKKALPIAGVTMPSTEHLWGLREIEDQGGPRGLHPWDWHERRWAGLCRIASASNR